MVKISRVIRPGGEIRGLNPPKPHRNPNPVLQTRGDQNMPAQSFHRLVEHEIGVNGRLRPENDDALRRIELGLNDPVETLADLNAAIPPDGPALLLDCMRKELRTLAVFASVAEEHVCQSVPLRKNSRNDKLGGARCHYTPWTRRSYQLPKPSHPPLPRMMCVDIVHLA